MSKESSTIIPSQSQSKKVKQSNSQDEQRAKFIKNKKKQYNDKKMQRFIQENGQLSQNCNKIIEQLFEEKNKIKTKIKESKQYVMTKFPKNEKAQQLQSKITHKQKWLQSLGINLDNLQTRHENGDKIQQNEVELLKKINKIYLKSFQKLNKEEQEKLNQKIKLINDKQNEKLAYQNKVKQKKPQGSIDKVLTLISNLFNSSPQARIQSIKKKIEAINNEMLEIKIQDLQGLLKDADQQVDNCLNQHKLKIQLDKSSSSSYYGILQFAENGIKELRQSALENA